MAVVAFGLAAYNLIEQTKRRRATSGPHPRDHEPTQEGITEGRPGKGAVHRPGTGIIEPLSPAPEDQGGPAVPRTVARWMFIIAIPCLLVSLGFFIAEPSSTAFLTSLSLTMSLMLFYKLSHASIAGVADDGQAPPRD